MSGTGWGMADDDLDTLLARARALRDQWRVAVAAGDTKMADELRQRRYEVTARWWRLFWQSRGAEKIIANRPASSGGEPGAA